MAIRAPDGANKIEKVAEHIACVDITKSLWKSYSKVEKVAEYRSLCCYNRKCEKKSFRKIKKVAEHISLSWHNKKIVNLVTAKVAEYTSFYCCNRKCEKSFRKMKKVAEHISGIYELAFSLADKTGIAWKSFSKIEKVAEWARINKP